MKRLGKFYMTTSAVTSGGAAEVFGHLGFVPYRCEHLMYMDKFEYIGTSFQFEQVEEGYAPPEYVIEVSEADDETIRVTAIAI